ncbi:DHHC palmitoyltransferase-domain-containing protein [Syncephalastrum racemosum]|uniref:Palmitoyltransferase n=1 Tax=Syncephalastrum racemosum TaxID=13706 RepID=A0A1X2H6M3_SYNRA|nr:DHHC palmitoyltransferase-domain-containing protein [Syncephalastrum racemosum]
MNILAYVVLSLLLFGLIVFVLLFGQNPRLRNGPIGKLHIVLTERLPRGVVAALKMGLGKTNWHRILRCWRYCFQARNPFLQIFFLVLTAGSIALFLTHAKPHIPNIYLRPMHSVIIPVQIVGLYVVYFVACMADPGIVTKENVARLLEIYPYDHIIYEPKDCSTCQLPKPARSKHCTMCNACISRLDHHCAWINRCVGANNHRYFFLFLFYLTQFCAYGAYLCFQVYRGFILDWGLDKAYVLDRTTGEKYPITFRKAMLHILQKDRMIGSICILASVASLVVGIFFLYQLYLAGRGVTTNEAFKWEMLEDSIDRGEFWMVDDDSSSDPPGCVPPTSQTSARRRQTSRDKKQQQTESPATAAAAAPRVRRRQIKSLDQVDNIYDKGFFRNLWEIVCPPR